MKGGGKLKRKGAFKQWWSQYSHVIGCHAMDKQVKGRLNAVGIRVQSGKRGRGRNTHLPEDACALGKLGTPFLL